MAAWIGCIVALLGVSRSRHAHVGATQPNVRSRFPRWAVALRNLHCGWCSMPGDGDFIEPDTLGRGDEEEVELMVEGAESGDDIESRRSSSPHSKPRGVAAPALAASASDPLAISASLTALLSAAFLVLQNSTAVLIMRYTLVKQGENEYLTQTAVVMGELLKTTCSFGLVFRQEGTVSGVWENKVELLKTSAPALLYLLQNNLQYVAVQNLTASTFQVVYQLKLLTTAILWVLVFRTKLSRGKWIALLVLVTGIVIVRSDPAKGFSAASASNMTTGLEHPSRPKTGVSEERAHMGH